MLQGLPFSIPLILILLAHELGHYLACRAYRLPATLPYFLPVPFGLGTFGAFIKIQVPIRAKHQLFDVGVAGPLAGFVVLLPVLAYGLANSEPIPLPEVEEPEIFLGFNLLLYLGMELFHGGGTAGWGLSLHPAGVAAWVGMLATALNLLPLGQLDGGHILYAVAGRWQRRLAWPLLLLLVAAGFLWPVWWLWCLFVFLMGLKHPPVRDEAVPLSLGRQVLALVALGILVLCFMPQPVGIIVPEGY